MLCFYTFNSHLTRCFTIIIGCFFISFLVSCDSNKKSNAGGVAGFEGVYQVRENCSIGGYSGYSIRISPSGTNNNQVNVYNFYNLGSSKYIVAETDGLLLSFQPQSYSGFTVWGNGSINGNILVIDFKVDDGAVLDSCSATCTKQ